MLAERVPGLGDDEAGARLPELPALRPEHPPCLSRPLSGARPGYPRPKRPWLRRRTAPRSGTLCLPPEESGSARCRSHVPLLPPGRRPAASGSGRRRVRARPRRAPGSVFLLRRDRKAPREGRRGLAPPVRGYAGHRRIRGPARWRRTTPRHERNPRLPARGDPTREKQRLASVSERASHTVSPARRKYGRARLRSWCASWKRPKSHSGAGAAHEHPPSQVAAWQSPAPGPARPVPADCGQSRRALLRGSPARRPRARAAVTLERASLPSVSSAIAPGRSPRSRSTIPIAW